MYYNVKVFNDEYLNRLSKAVEYSDETLAGTVAQLAFLHATAVMGLLPEELKGKLLVSVADVGAGDVGVTVSYTMKDAPEGATTQVGQMFIPQDKLGNFSSRRPVISKASGESGVYLSGIQRTGRPSIQSYLMNQTRKIMEQANELTQEAAYEMARNALVEWFAQNGIVYRAGAGRYQATRDVTLPWGQDVPNTHFVVGDF